MLFTTLAGDPLAFRKLFLERGKFSHSLKANYLKSHKERKYNVQCSLHPSAPVPIYIYESSYKHEKQWRKYTTKISRKSPQQGHDVTLTSTRRSDVISTSYPLGRRIQIIVSHTTP